MAPTLVFLFVSPTHAPAMRELAPELAQRLAGAALLGCTAQAVVGEDREVEEAAAFAVWAGRLGKAEAAPFWLSMEYTADGPSVIGLGEVPEDARALLLLAEPHSFPTQALLTRMNAEAPGIPVIGGQASGGGPGENVMVMGAETRRSGAVGVFLNGEVSVRTVVSQGCRPIGSPYIITHGQSNVIELLAGRPPLERVSNIAGKATPQEQEMIRNSLQVGLVIDELKTDPQRGDFLIRPIVNADFETGAIAIGDLAAVGRTVQFQLRDAATADEDLKS
ncbi:MAG: FIST N-terminal domain-containing protein, partial [Actinomycetota bacterium]